jgi:hypothetical protein
MRILELPGRGEKAGWRLDRRKVTPTLPTFLRMRRASAARTVSASADARLSSRLGVEGGDCALATQHSRNSSPPGPELREEDIFRTFLSVLSEASAACGEFSAASGVNGGGEVAGLLGAEVATLAWRQACPSEPADWLRLRGARSRPHFRA